MFKEISKEMISTHFDCGDEDINYFLKHLAMSNQE